MNATANAIQSEGLTGTAAELPAVFAADTAWPEDPTLYSIGQLRVVIGNLYPKDQAAMLQAMRLLLGTIQAASAQDPLVAAFSQKLNTVGIPFNDPVTQITIDTLAAAGSWPDELRDAIKAIGIPHGPLWKKPSLGIPFAPDESACQAALDEIAEQAAADAAAVARDNLRRWLRTRCDAIDLQIIAGNLTTQEQVVDAWGE